MSQKELPYINSINLNIHTVFPYLVLNVTNDVAIPRNPGFQVMHWHEDLQFIYVLEGCIRIRTLNETVLLHEHEGIYINKSIVHLVEKIDHCVYKSFLFPDYFLSFYPGSPARELTTAITENANLTLVPLQNADWEQEILNHLEKLVTLETDKTAFYPYEVLTTLSNLWLIFLKHVTVPKQNTSNPTSHRMQCFLQYIEMHYAQNITLDDLAQSANVSKSECLRCFKQTLQTTPFRYLIDFRLSKATKLLKETNLNIKEIMNQTGFHDQSYFGKCFRQKTGCSPKKYQRKIVK